MSTTQNRNTMLDAMRGIAALAVVVTHIQVKLVDANDRIKFDFGVFGVTLFFLCSGFIIPVSISRSASLRVFWIRRFFRLYPLYWFSIGCWLFLALFGVYGWTLLTPNQYSLTTIIANVLMIQSFVHVQNISFLYWTLGVEMLFYLVVSWSSLLRRNVGSFWSVVVCVLCSFIFDIVLQREFLPAYTFFYLSVILLGAFLYTANKHSYKWQLRLIVVMILQFVLLFFRPNESTNYTISFCISYGLAISCFALGLFGKTRVPPKPLVQLGVWSYSLYILHLLVLTLVPPLINPLVSLVVWASLSIGLAALSYHVIELPMMRLGKKYTSHQEPITPPAPTEG